MEDKCRADVDDTIAYYEHNAEEFVKSTLYLDVSELYLPFEELIPPRARILDLGCGCGRDSRYFMQQGYDVIAIDPSLEMCEQTSTFAKVPVYKMKAEELQFIKEFDAVWACASLLHVQRSQQEMVIRLIGRSLKNEGICYCSWKYGVQDRKEKGRLFTDYTEKTFELLLKRIPFFRVVKVWVTDDLRKDQKQKWLNVIIKKTGDG